MKYPRYMLPTLTTVSTSEDLRQTDSLAKVSLNQLMEEQIEMLDTLDTSI